MKTNDEAPIGGLKLKDVVKAVILFFIATLVAGIYHLLESGDGFTWTNIKTVLIAAALASVSYLVKNILTNSNDEFLKTEK